MASTGNLYGGATKVAAVCYRQAGDALEFLLVRTASGRWTFPKGNIEPHLGPRDSAALEALEEAGVLGRISSQQFTTYLHGKGGDRTEFVVAYLLNVWARTDPEEPRRDPTWFRPRAAKRALRLGRTSLYHRELERVIDEALSFLSPDPVKNVGQMRFFVPTAAYI